MISAVEGLYKMGEAAIKGDWEALRNESYNLLTLGVLMKFGETPKLKRDIQLSVKNVEFLQQKIKRGVIEETPLKDIQYKPEGVAKYAIEKVDCDSSGIPVTDAPARVVSEATLLDNAKGSLEKTPDGKVEPACFIGNTTVHTYGDYGYAQSHIEDLWVGDLVLSRCEKTGELAYRPIVDFFEHDDRETWTVTHRNGGGLEETLWTTAEHPFWIQGLGWTPVSQLKPGQLLEISNPFMTGGNIDGVDRTMEQALASIGRATSTVVSVQRQEWRTKVYNFEVEGFHTYFVGDLGAWVHNKSVNSPHSTLLERSSPDAVPHGNPAQVPTVGDAGTIAGRIGENNAAKAVAEAA